MAGKRQSVAVEEPVDASTTAATSCCQAGYPDQPHRRFYQPLSLTVALVRR